MRLFIASPIILDNYAGIRNDFDGIIEGKWVKEEHLHLTWVFLGERSDEESVIKMMQNIPALQQEVEIAGVGYFGRPPRIFFADAANKLLYDKAAEFKEAGFDLYRFKPHITLCRIKKIHDYRNYKALIIKYKERILGEVKREIILYESRLHGEGPEYLCRWENPAI